MDYKKLHEETLWGLQKMVLEGKITEEIAKNICADFTIHANNGLIRSSLIKHFKEIQADNPSYVWAGIPVQNIISWLEHVGMVTYELDAPIGQNLEGRPVRIEDLQNQNAGWSDEDYNDIETIACHLDNLGHDAMGAKLRELRDKGTWKPSKDQIKALDMVRKGICVGPIESGSLDDLYVQLKKL